MGQLSLCHCQKCRKEDEEKVLKNSFLNFKEIPNNHFYSYT